MKKTISQQEAIAALTELIQLNQDTESRKNGFGYGFYRWVKSIDLKYKLNISFSDVRRVFKKLSDDGLIQREAKSGQYNKYSTNGWDGCKPVNDYFIELEDHNTL